MDTRKKLVELLKTNACPSPFICDQACKYYGYGDCFPDRFADYLIANGVTIQELDGCEYCRIASYTENPFIVITQMGREVKTKFNFCPHCGRRLPHPPKGE